MSDPRSNRVYVLVGVACLAAGGLLLALPGDVGTVLGTTAGLAGVALLGWGWARR